MNLKEKNFPILYKISPSHPHSGDCEKNYSKKLVQNHDKIIKNPGPQPKKLSD